MSELTGNTGGVVSDRYWTDIEYISDRYWSLDRYWKDISQMLGRKWACLSLLGLLEGVVRDAKKQFEQHTCKFGLTKLAPKTPKLRSILICHKTSQTIDKIDKNI